MKSIKHIFLILLLIISQLFSYSQNIYDYKKLIKVLSSDTLYGRGYVNNGINKAASIIESEFKTIGIKPFFNDSYFQNFNIKVNTFPDKITLIIDDQEVIPGIDYLIDPSSISIKGKYKVVTIRSVDVFNMHQLAKKVNKSRNKFLCIDFRNDSIYNDSLKNILKQTLFWIENKKGMPYKGIIKITNKKLTWNVSENIKHIPIIELYSEKNDREIKKVKIDLQNIYYNYEVKNVAGLLEGNLFIDTFIIISAHYDHLGMMGTKTYFPGANDNASGVAMMISLANYFKLNAFPYSIIFVAFASEELGLKGANYFYSNLSIEKEKIKFLINLDLVGSGENGIAIVNALKYENMFKKIDQINQEKKYFSYIKKRGEACNGDHCVFDREGIPCFSIYTLGKSTYYHDVNDNYDNCSLEGFENLLNLLKDFIYKL